MPRRFALNLLPLSLLLAACGTAAIPDPREAALAYAQAAKRTDADALYEMLSAKAKRSLTREEVRKVVTDEKSELQDQAKALSAPGLVIKSEARMRFADGEEVALSVQKDGYKIIGAEALPSVAQTPVQILGQLRSVIARRSYAGLIRVLTPASRATTENDFRTLVEGLENPEGLDIQVNGDSAFVSLPNGHWVRMKRDGESWHVDDFE